MPNLYECKLCDLNRLKLVIIINIYLLGNTKLKQLKQN